MGLAAGNGGLISLRGSEMSEPSQEPVTGVRGGESSRGSGALRQHVREITESPTFKGSRRGQQFLRYVVEKVIEGRSDQLKERNLGVELFGRTPSYDTGEDAIVRVTASDVRKRLHQYYAGCGFTSSVRIELPSGSYIPEFREVAPELIPEPPALPPRAVPAEPARRQWRLLLIVLCAVAAVLLGGSAWQLRQRIQANRMSPGSLLPWSALLEPGRQIRVVLSDPDISTLQESFGFHITLSDYANLRYLPDGLSLDSDMRRLVHALRGLDVALVDVPIAQRISEIAQARSRNVKTDNARSLKLADFRTDDSFVILGSPRSNPWSALYEDQLDFAFVYDENYKREIIRNVRPKPGEPAAYIPTAKGGDTGQVFGILAFVRNLNQSGQVLLIAGTTAEATEAAGKLAADAALLSQTLRRYGIDPIGPPCRFEVLLRVRAMAGEPETFEVVTCHRLQGGGGDVRSGPA